MVKLNDLPVARRFISVFFAGALAGVPLAHATDAWEPLDSTWDVFTATPLIPGHPPQQHDLQAVGGVADVDWYTFVVRPARSYEVITQGYANMESMLAFSRNSGETTVLQNSTQFVSAQVGGAVQYLSATVLRWQEGLTPTSRQYIKVTAYSGYTAAQKYFIQLRETTLFCPRFNNASTQVSVLMVQGTLDGSNSCQYSAHFFGEGGTLLATQPGTLFAFDAQITPLHVISLPGVSGLAGQKGSAQISHTCGYGNIKAKLVALEPATGFSFDTPCTVREQ